METSLQLELKLPGPLEWTHKLALLVGDPDITLTLELWQLWSALGRLMSHDTRPKGPHQALSLLSADVFKTCPKIRFVCVGISTDL